MVLLYLTWRDGIKYLPIQFKYKQAFIIIIYFFSPPPLQGISGLISDGRQLAETAKTEASEYRSKYGGNIPLHLLNERVSMYVHAYTLYSMVRPFGASLLLASHDKTDGPSLYVVGEYLNMHVQIYGKF